MPDAAALACAPALHHRGDMAAHAERFRHIARLVGGPGVDLDAYRAAPCACRDAELCGAADVTCCSCARYGIECHADCRCMPRCRRAVVCRGPPPDCVLRVCETRHKGLGLFAATPIARGAFVCEYAGEVLRMEELRRRLGRPVYVVIVREHVDNGRRVLRTVIDATRCGNVARYINHGCEPNLVARPVRAGYVIPSLAFYAARDIATGEELCWSYTDEARAVGQSRTRCRCGAATCVGRLPRESL